MGGFEITEIISFLFGISVALFSFWGAIQSYLEKEIIAAKRILLFGIPLACLFFVIPPAIEEPIVSLILPGIAFIAGIVLLIPLKAKHNLYNDIPSSRIDERDIMFSRKLLAKEEDRYKAYYSRNPELKETDDIIRSKPGLLSPKSSLYDEVLFATTNATFQTVELLHSGITGESKGKKQKLNSSEITTYIKTWAKQLGAVSVGITELKDYHFYSVAGREDNYGEEIINNHQLAIAFTVEMNKEMIDTAPMPPAVMESARQYLSAGIIAVQIAGFVRNMGYDARAHIDGKYQVVCPLVARDAGLGEIGRMGLLMTPELGPRVRLGVITTNLPLVADKRVREESVVEFCEICKKCADVCPSGAIPKDSGKMINGAFRWQISSEKCYELWCDLGTDCGRCMSVCPYSHPNNLLHNIVRFGIKTTPYSQKLP